MGFGMHIGWAIEVGRWVGGWIQFIKNRHSRSQQVIVRPPSFALTYSLTHIGSDW
jgi:hypothetical protein